MWGIGFGKHVSFESMQVLTALFISQVTVGRTFVAVCDNSCKIAEWRQMVERRGEQVCEKCFCIFVGEGGWRGGMGCCRM